MSSFVTDVLVIAGELEKDKLVLKISEIKDEIMKLNNDVKDFLKDNYVEFSTRLTDVTNCYKSAESLLEETKALQSRIDDQIKVELSGSTEELKKLKATLNEYNVSLKISKNLLTIHECIETIEEVGGEASLLKTAHSLKKIEDIIDNPNNNFSYLDIYQVLDEKYAELLSIFMANSSIIWNKCVTWDNSEKFVKGAVFKLTIQNTKQLAECMRALSHLTELKSFINDFCNDLLENIIKPLIKYETTIKTSQESIFKLEITCMDKRPDCQYVLHYILLLFKYLYANFNLSINGKSVMETLSSFLMTEICSILHTECLYISMPTSMADLKKFHPIKEDLKELRNYLEEIGVISMNDNNIIWNYILSPEGICAEKINKTYLNHARTIIKKNLHETFRYEEEAIPDTIKEIQDLEIRAENALCTYTFHFPSCLISSNVKELYDYTRTVVTTILDCGSFYSYRTLFVCRSLIDLYIGLTLDHHKECIETIPQQGALFHNNCMYLSHHVMLLSYLVRQKQVDVGLEINMLFLDQTVKLRDIGSDVFLKHMNYQQNLISDIIKESGLTTLGLTSFIPPNVERAIRQCIRQLELLKTAWKDVLPEKVFCKALANISGFLINDLITKVIAAEDISASEASDLAIIFKRLKSRIQEMFPDPTTIEIQVPKWEKFGELIIVLGASLKEIECRWENGEGSLAKQFLPSDMKKLIRALFQNTERRSNLLAQIK